MIIIIILQNRVNGQWQENYTKTKRKEEFQARSSSISDKFNFNYILLVQNLRLLEYPPSSDSPSI